MVPSYQETLKERAMAKNPPKGDGHRIGAVRGRSTRSKQRSRSNHDRDDEPGRRDPQAERG